MPLWNLVLTAPCFPNGNPLPTILNVVELQLTYLKSQILSAWPCVWNPFFRQTVTFLNRLPSMKAQYASCASQIRRQLPCLLCSHSCLDSRNTHRVDRSTGNPSNILAQGSAFCNHWSSSRAFWGLLKWCWNLKITYLVYLVFRLTNITLIWWLKIPNKYFFIHGSNSNSNFRSPSWAFLEFSQPCLSSQGNQGYYNNTHGFDVSQLRHANVLETLDQTNLQNGWL